MSDATALNNFKTQVKQALAADAGVSVADVTITSIESGSVVVNSEVRHSSLSDAQTYSTNFNANSAFSSSNGFDSTTYPPTGGSSSSSELSSGSGSCETTTTTSDDDDNSGDMIIGIVVGIVIALVIGCGGGYFIAQSCGGSSATSAKSGKSMPPKAEAKGEPEAKGEKEQL